MNSNKPARLCTRLQSVRALNFSLPALFPNSEETQCSARGEGCGSLAVALFLDRRQSSNSEMVAPARIATAGRSSLPERGQRVACPQGNYTPNKSPLRRDSLRQDCLRRYSSKFQRDRLQLEV